MMDSSKIENGSNIEKNNPSNLPERELFVGTFLRPHIICEDGFEISVQTGKDFSCEPKINKAEKYTQVEIGTSTSLGEEFEEYFNPDSPQPPYIYGYVPVSMIEQLIMSHGGPSREKMEEKIRNTIKKTGD